MAKGSRHLPAHQPSTANFSVEIGHPTRYSEHPHTPLRGAAARLLRESGHVRKSLPSKTTYSSPRQRRLYSQPIGPAFCRHFCRRAKIVASLRNRRGRHDFRRQRTILSRKTRFATNGSGRQISRSFQLCTDIRRSVFWRRCPSKCCGPLIFVAPLLDLNYCASNDFGILSRKTSLATQEAVSSRQRTSVAKNASRDKSLSATE
jgi:hypothetical protein